MSKHTIDPIERRRRNIAEYTLIMNELCLPMTADELRQLQECDLRKMDIVFSRIRNRRLGV